ncbi:MAG: DUF3226 domain-containing protein [Pyrinomonadaceae bacterium]
MAIWKRVLLVEGINDKHVINNLLKAHGIENKITIRDKEGIANILATLKTEVDANQDFLGIVVDANASLDSRWQSLTDRLKDGEIGYSSVPDNPVKEGLILDSEGFLPKLGVWVMPNNELIGKIEDFIRFLVAEERERLWQIAEKAVSEIPDEQRLFAAKDIIKAQVHTFLAWQDEPGRPMGESITRRYFQIDAPEAINFVNWIRRLYL